MKHLYIIGNGFDCHHNMATSYTEFRKWLKATDNSTLCTINELFGLMETHLEEDDEDDENVEGKVEYDEVWWQHFEQNLASAVTSDIVMNEIEENYPNFSSDDFSDANWSDAEYAVEYKLNEAYDEIRMAFEDWIAQLEMGDESRKISIHQDDSFFLTFNYTSTLEDLYGINPNNILHIHGKACNGEKLILGHGVSREDIKDMVDEDALPEEEVEGDFVWLSAKDAAVEGVYRQRKPVDEIIRVHEDWFNSLKDVTNIYIYGFSFGDVDLPYFRKILSVVDKKNVTIEVNDYQGKNKPAIEHFMISEGIKPTQYTIVDLEDKLIVRENQ